MHQDSNACQMWSTEKSPSRDDLSRDIGRYFTFPLPLEHRVGGILEGNSNTNLFPTTVRDGHMKTLVASAIFLWVHKRNKSWWLESSKVYLLGCGFLSRKAESRRPLLEAAETGVKNLWQSVMTCKDPISTVVRKGDTVRTKRYRSQPDFKKR